MRKKAVREKVISMRAIWRIMPIVVVALIVVFVLSQKATLDSKRIKIKTVLEKTNNISELSSAQFVYNGIAQVYKDEERRKVKYNVRYNATVKVGIQMDQVEFSIDEENKVLTAALPPIEILETPIDPTDIGYIPENTKGELKEVLSACREDVQTEAQEAGKLYEVAEENAKSTISALLYPILQEYDYEIAWKN